MKAVKKIAIAIAVLLLCVFVCGVIGRCITGAWNPKEWKPSGESSTPDDTNKSDEGENKDPETPPLSSEIITDNFECYFDSVFATQARYSKNYEVKNRLNSNGVIEVKNGASCVVCAEHTYCNNVMFYRGTMTTALKMETATVLVFETSVPMELYLWLDDVEPNSPSSTSSIRVDGERLFSTKVVDDDYGYEIRVMLSAGEHVIQTDSYCVLPYLSLTVIETETPVIPYEPVSANVISEYTELMFTEFSIESGRWYLPAVDKFTITSDISYGRACSYSSLYGGKTTVGLKMETSTLIRFETSVPMELYMWLDDVFYKGYASIRVDSGSSKSAQKVADDKNGYGYMFKITLPAGEHIIQKGSFCVLSYLSLTPV